MKNKYFASILAMLTLYGCSSNNLNGDYKFDKDSRLKNENIEFQKNVSEQAQSSLEFLTKWGDGEHVYNLYNFRDIEIHESFQKSDLLEEWFEDDIREQGYDFLDIGYNRAGDPYALWVYPELTGEPPVVLLDSDGDVELLAPSLIDFLCLLTDENTIKGKTEINKTIWYKIYKYQYEEISEESDIFKSSDEVATKIIKEINQLRSEISIIQECRSEEIIIKDFSRHPNFEKWFKENFSL